MKKNSIFLFLLFSFSTVYAYDDFDMDGVDDAHDKCPNTLFSDLVDIKGCTIESLQSPHHFDIIVGADYAQTNYRTTEKTDIYASSIQLDYYYKSFSLQASTSYFNSKSSSFNENGFNDSTLALYYDVTLFSKLSVKVGAGIILPTYKTTLNNNKSDYMATLNLSYQLKDFNCFGGYNYIQINDDDINTTGVSITYQDIEAYNFGFGYYMSNQTYTSISYNNAKSLYQDIEDIESASWYFYHSLNDNYFITFSYAYGLSQSASKHSSSLKIGYYF